MNLTLFRNIFIHAGLLSAFWLALSGLFDVFHVTLGIISVVLVILVNYRLRNYHFFREETSPGIRLNLFRFLLFIPWLVKEIVIASLQVAFIVLHPRVPANPAVLRFKTHLPNMRAKVILGNSITLTPGTLTLWIKNDEFLVHSLADFSSNSILSGSLPLQVARLYLERPEDVVSDLVIIKSKKDL